MILVVNWVWQFWEALLVTGITIAILATAAWGSFVASGQYRSQPGLAKGALGLTLLVSIACAGFVAAIVAGILIYGTRSSAPDFQQYVVNNQGRVLRVTISGHDYYTILAATDLAGKPTSQYTGKKFYDLRQTSFLDFRVIAWPHNRHAILGYTHSERYVQMLSSGQTDWFYIVARRLIVGYDRQTRRCIGSIGPAGFSPAPAVPAELFPAGQPVTGGWNQMRLIVFPEGAYYIDFADRQARLLVKGTADQPVLGAGKLPMNDQLACGRPRRRQHSRPHLPLLSPLEAACFFRTPISIGQISCHHGCRHARRPLRSLVPRGTRS